MRAEVHGLQEFYATPTGAVAARLVRERLHALWPNLRGMSVLGGSVRLAFFVGPLLG